MAVSIPMNAALNEESVTMFTAVQIALPADPLSDTTDTDWFKNYRTINLIDTAGFVKFDPKVAFISNGSLVTFTGCDDEYGSLGGVPTISASMSQESPRLQITLMPPTDEAVGLLCHPRVQGSPIRVWEGCVDNRTGEVIGEPYRCWTGFLDLAFVSRSAESRSVDIESATVIERFLMPSEGEKLTSEYLTYHYGGNARGLDFNTEATEELVWGKEGINSKPLTTK